MGSVDRKYDGSLCKVASGEEVTDFIVFRARDNAVPTMLTVYRALCEGMGCDEEHLQSIDILKKEVLNWRALHPGECHPPTTSITELQAKLKED